MATYANPIQSDSLLGHLKSKLEDSKLINHKVCVRNVAIELDGEWKNVSYVALFGMVHEDSTISMKKSIEYEDTLFLENWYDPNQFLDHAKELLSDDYLVDGYKISFNMVGHNWQTEFLPNDNEYSRLPCNVYRNSSNNSHKFLDRALLSYDAPFYHSTYHAIAEWYGSSKPISHSDARLGEIVFVLPENRAWIDRIDNEDGDLAVKVTNINPGTINLKIKGAWFSSETCQSFEYEANKPPVRIKKPDLIHSVEFWLIGDDGSKYDFYKETPYWSDSKKRVLYGQSGNPDNPKLVEDALLKGEGPNIEFKPYIDFDKKDNPKRKEILETIVAFANLSGGTLIIGINDFCEVVGIEKELLRKNNGPETRGIYEGYIGKLRKYVSDKLNKEVGLEICRTPFSGHTILVVKVPEGQSKPYMVVSSNEIFIRRGANNFRPNEDELKNIIKASMTGETLF